MKTVCYRINAVAPEVEILDEAAQLIRCGELVAFPTETVYGLGADALNREAVNKIFIAKGRMPDNPLIIHVSSKEQVVDLVKSIPGEAMALMERFWPGPLTLVMESSPTVPDVVRAGSRSVGVRMPRHPVALKLIERAGPLAAPSANRSGRPSPTTADHVRHDLEGRIAAILDAGPTGMGIESTVLQVIEKPYQILRPGGIPAEELEEVLPGLIARGNQIHPADKYPHYQTRADIIILSANEDIKALVDRNRHQGKKIGIVVHNVVAYSHIFDEMDKVYRVEAEPELAGRAFYSILRDADDCELDVLLFEPYAEQGTGAALMDRIRKASRR